MDKIWDRKSFEVGGHWPLCRQKVECKKKKTKKKTFQAYLPWLLDSLGRVTV